MAHGIRHLHYEPKLLLHFALATLEERRTRGNLIKTYKIMPGRERVDREQSF